MEHTRTPVADMAVLLDRARAANLAAADDEAVCALVAEIEALGRVVDAARVAVAGEADARSGRERGRDGLSQRHGYTRAAHLIASVARVSGAEASRRVRLGAAVRPTNTLSGEPMPARHPIVSVSLAAGELGAESAILIVNALDQAASSAAAEDLTAAEEALVEVAQAEAPALVAIHALAWREALDPDGAEPREDAIRARRSLRLGREVAGLTPFSGMAEPTLAALLRSAMSEGSAPGTMPRFLPPSDHHDGSDAALIHTADAIERLRDPRTREQRQHDILAGILAAGIRVSERRTDAAPGAAENASNVPLRPLSSVTAVVRLDDLRAGRGSGWLDDIIEPVSIATIRQLACDGGIRTAVLGENGEMLHLGRTRRLFTPAQRKALAVRDGGCVWPGCTAPPGWCQAHHVIEWENGGATDVDNGALLCSAHHHLLHASEFTMRMIRGRPQLLAPPWLDPEQAWRGVGRSRVTFAA